MSCQTEDVNVNVNVYTEKVTPGEGAIRVGLEKWIRVYQLKK